MKIVGEQPGSLACPSSYARTRIDREMQRIAIPVIPVTDSKQPDMFKRQKLRIWCRARHQLPPVWVDAAIARAPRAR